uniref:Uncharacterized protein n=1 Tax=Peronospora matthiolae TaxID=2874970 RepID=A0AAV1TZD1_9STRA
MHAELEEMDQDFRAVQFIVPKGHQGGTVRHCPRRWIKYSLMSERPGCRGGESNSGALCVKEVAEERQHVDRTIHALPVVEQALSNRLTPVVVVRIYTIQVV